MGTNPLLASAVDLDRWADTLESRGAFPELMRRLLAQTPGITNIDIRAHEGTAAPGWDGTATSDGSSFLPKGELRFEFGTDKQPKTKADTDYKKRVEKITGKSDEIFVFVTPRNWAGAASWTKERRQEGAFASVEAYDAHRLEGWLQSTPAVHYWLSEKLGKPVLGAQTLTSWWAQLRRNCTIEVPPEFHSVGRSNESERLMQLVSRDGTVFTVQALWRNDAVAFCHAVLLEKDHTELERTLVVSNPEAWRYLAMQSSTLILIPVFDNADIGLALENGHRVIHPVPVVNESRDDGDIVRLPKIDRRGGSTLLNGAGLDYSSADKLSSLSRRSMSGFYRRISVDKKRRQPEWAKDRKTVSVLAPLILVGIWDADNLGDRTEISRFVALEANKIDSLLDELVEVYPLDPPFVRSGGQWYLVDAVDAALLLLPKLSEDHKNRWIEFVTHVLLCEDPLEGLSFGESIIAQFEGQRSPVSPNLRQSVGRSLVLASIYSEKQTGSASSIAQCVDVIVNVVLTAALHDESGRMLRRLAPCFPSLAEAAPSVFLTSFEDDLDGDKPASMLLFNDRGFDLFGSSASIHYVLMAIELLCWSPDFFGRSVRLLIKLADLVPSEGEGSYCIEALEKILAVRLKLSAGQTEDKLFLAKWALDEYSDVGWYLANRLLSPKGCVVAPCEPVFRDWNIDKSVIPIEQTECYIHDLLQMMIRLAKCNLDRWLCLLSVIEDIPQRDCVMVAEALQDAVVRGGWESNDLFEIWSSVSSLVRRYQSSSQEMGKLSDERLHPFIDIMHELEPCKDPRRFAWIFDHEANVTVDGLSMWDAGYSERISEVRRNAILTVVEQGIEQLRILVGNVKDPWVAGKYISEVGSEFECEVIEWLVDERPGLRKAASSYILHVAEKAGTPWVLEVLNSDLQTLEGKKRFVAALPAKKVYWELVSEFESSLLEAYWNSVNVCTIECENRREAIDLLLKRGCVSQAITLFWWMLHDGPEPTPELVVEGLVCLVAASDQVGGQDLGSKVAELLAWLERVEPTPPELPMLEFQYFDFVPNHEPSNALYEYLGSNSDHFAQLILGVFLIDSNKDFEEIHSVYKQRCFSVLYQWKRLPGVHDDGTVDGAYLASWVDGARQLLRAEGGERDYDGQIGQILASSPEGTDGMWPAEAVRDLIESLKNPKMESGLVMGRLNRRGFAAAVVPVVPVVYEGDAQETDLAVRYLAHAREMNTRWPRTAAILRALAKDCEQEAVRQNIEAEQREDQD